MQNINSLPTLLSAISSRKLTLALAGCAILSPFSASASTIEGGFDASGQTVQFDSPSGVIDMSAASGVTEAASSLGYETFSTIEYTVLDAPAPPPAIGGGAAGIAATPEPSSLLLIGTGAVAFFVRKRKKA